TTVAAAGSKTYFISPRVLTVSLDAAGSTDEDGPLTGFEWDFGDGTTGSGDTATRTFGQPGTYPVTLIVSDNRWPHVTRSLTRQVTVGCG
ncbi:MAG: PKD domain-containing protein, partial [Actinophytocola sp.]|nr:PKD domain-containing protein [Actinophytocola sp.]